MWFVFVRTSAAVLIEGIVFVLLSLTSFSEKLVNEVPANLKYGIWQVSDYLSYSLD